MFINFASKCYQVRADNADRSSRVLSFRRSEVRNEKYYQNINISLYGCDDDYG